MSNCPSFARAELRPGGGDQFDFAQARGGQQDFGQRTARKTAPGQRVVQRGEAAGRAVIALQWSAGAIKTRVVEDGFDTILSPALTLKEREKCCAPRGAMKSVDGHEVMRA